MERSQILWHDLSPWPVPERAEWRDITAYLREPATEQRLAELERDHTYPDEPRRALHALGLPHFLTEPLRAERARVPDFAGVSGDSCLTMPDICGLNALVASVNTSLAVTVSVNTLALLPAYIGANDEQLADVFARVGDGAFGSLLLTELDRGSDLFNIETRAEPGTLDASGRFTPLDAGVASGGTAAHYRLTGRKDLINGAGRHELLMVFARTKPKSAGPASPLAAHGSFSLFLVGRGPGVSSPRRWHTAPAPGADIASLQLDGVIVPAARRIGREGDGFSLVQRTLAVTRGGVASLAAGLTSRATRMAARYAAARQIYGRSLASLGAIADHLLRMRALELLVASLSVKATALINLRGAGAAYHAGVAKVACCALTEELVDEGRRLHGSRALLLDEPYHQLVADAPLFGTFDGTAHVVLDQLQRSLAQFAAVDRVPAQGGLDIVREAYLTPPRRLLVIARERAGVPFIHPVGHLRELDALAGGGALVPLLALADGLVALVRHCRGTGVWDDDQGLRFEAARLLADLEALIAALELTDPFLRPALGLPPPAPCPSVIGPLIEFTYGWFGGRIAAALRSLSLRAGVPGVGPLDGAEAAFARACAHGRQTFRRVPDLLLEGYR